MVLYLKITKEINMTPKQFEICKVFHLELIRPSVKDETIANTIDFLFNDVEQKKATDRDAVDKFLKKINERFDSLIAWTKSKSVDDYIKIYNKNNTRNPSKKAFLAAFEVVNGSRMHPTSIKHEVNYQCVYVLVPRLERWNKYSKMLIDTL